MASRLHPFWEWIAWSVLGTDAFDRPSLFLVFCLGRMSCLAIGPWIVFGGPKNGLGASLRISPMLCNYIKFQDCK